MTTTASADSVLELLKYNYGDVMRNKNRCVVGKWNDAVHIWNVAPALHQIDCYREISLLSNKKEENRTQNARKQAKLQQAIKWVIY